MNLACHLAATGRSVLITSQRDKALSVVDDKLQELGVRGFPMTLLRHDKDAKHELLERLADAGGKIVQEKRLRRSFRTYSPNLKSCAADMAPRRAVR